MSPIRDFNSSYFEFMTIKSAFGNLNILLDFQDYPQFYWIPTIQWLIPSREAFGRESIQETPHDPLDSRFDFFVKYFSLDL